jgi:hypothetical protein
MRKIVCLSLIALVAGCDSPHRQATAYNPPATVTTPVETTTPAGSSDDLTSGQQQVLSAAKDSGYSDVTPAQVKGICQSGAVDCEK